MRLAIASILLLLVSASAVHAECAWVLWARRLEGNLFYFNPGLVYDSLPACERAKENNARSWSMQDEQKWPAELRSAHPGFWRCLPDTVDPRGPKGTK